MENNTYFADANIITLNNNYVTECTNEEKWKYLMGYIEEVYCLLKEDNNNRHETYNFILDDEYGQEELYYIDVDYIMINKKIEECPIGSMLIFTTFCGSKIEDLFKSDYDSYCEAYFEEDDVSVNIVSMKTMIGSIDMKYCFDITLNRYKENDYDYTKIEKERCEYYKLLSEIKKQNVKSIIEISALCTWYIIITDTNTSVLAFYINV